MINETKICFFEKINETDKILTTVIKEKERETERETEREGLYKSNQK